MTVFLVSGLLTCNRCVQQIYFTIMQQHHIGWRFLYINRSNFRLKETIIEAYISTVRYYNYRPHIRIFATRRVLLWLLQTFHFSFNYYQQRKFVIYTMIVLKRKNLNHFDWNRLFFLRLFVPLEMNLSQKNEFNPNLARAPILYTLKTIENLWFSGVFSGYRIGTLPRNGLS